MQGEIFKGTPKVQPQQATSADLQAPLVSIITPAYNAEKYIADTIRSVKNQTYLNWELIISVDNKSSDETEKIAHAFAKKDQRIKVLKPEDGNGPALNRNFAISAARGKYLAFLDADDLWHGEKLSRQIDFMEEKSLAFSYTGYQWIDEDGSELFSGGSAPEKISYKDLIKHRHSIGCLTVVLRKDSFDQLSCDDIGAEDLTFWLKLLRQIPYAYGLNENLAKYRIVNGSRSRNKIKWAMHRWQTLREAEHYPVAKSLYYFSHYAVNSLKKYGRAFGFNSFKS